MNLYLISAKTQGYDVYSDAVVVASSSLKARKIHPNGGGKPLGSDDFYDTWVSNYLDVTARRIGTATNEWKEGDVICASFHAG